MANNPKRRTFYALLAALILWAVYYYGDFGLENQPLSRASNTPPVLKLEQSEPLTMTQTPSEQPSYSTTNSPVEQPQCNMEDFIKRQEAASKRRLGSIEQEFTKVQHVFGAHTQLSVYHKNIRSQTIDALIERLALVHQLYGQLLGERASKFINLNLVILSSRAEYEDYTSRYGFDPRASQGVFFHGSNSAFIEYKNDEQVVATAVHEAVHAMNLRLIGLTPRWLNEGMAQLLENVSKQDGVLRFNPDPRALQSPPYDIYALLESESQWGSVDMGRLYYSGWSWLSYIISNDSGMKMLTRLIGRESENPCDVLSSDESYDILQSTSATFEQDFHHWLDAVKPQP
ncbi:MULTISPECIES: hypothetical protein [Pseudoalteromonas]|uniref:hypothetical protein n=1 Tax=Pseudoalteromonas TaxID=53246 RepID=UPI000A5FE1CE|nr:MULTISPECIES: hypothetical protein [Pseudoalteromonas]